MRDSAQLAPLVKFVRTYVRTCTYVLSHVRTYVRAVEAESVRAYVRGGPGATDTTRHIHARWRWRPGAFTRPGATGTPGAPGRSYARTYVRNQRAYFSPKSNFPEPRTKSKLRTYARTVRTYVPQWLMGACTNCARRALPTYVRTSMYVRTCVRAYVRTCTRACIQRRLHLGCRASTGGSCGPPAHANVPRPTDVRMLRKTHPCRSHHSAAKGWASGVPRTLLKSILLRELLSRLFQSSTASRYFSILDWANSLVSRSTVKRST